MNTAHPQAQHHDTLAEREVAAAEAAPDLVDALWRWALKAAMLALATGVLTFVLGVLVGRLTSHC